MFEPTESLLSWGRVPRCRQLAATVAWQDQALPLVREATARHGSVLVRGMGRSYGDCGLNPEGPVIMATSLDRLMAFNPTTRRLRVEAGVTIAALLRFLLPQGYFLPVVPGTSLVTVGGAIANDVHGKNHRTAGTFGGWVRKIALLRSDGSEHELDPSDGGGLFAATIGGIGLTGLIRWAELEVVPVPGPAMETETRRFDSLEEGLALAAEPDPAWTHDVAWVDCNATGLSLGRGLMFYGRHAPGAVRGSLAGPRLAVPDIVPGWVMNGVTMKAFNALYGAMGRLRAGRRRLAHVAPYFFPLDAIGEWNRLHGRRGFFQHQSVVPWQEARPVLRAMLREVAAAGEGSPLTVLKAFGDTVSPGLMSFPMPGVTLTLDLCNRGGFTGRLLARLDGLVREAGGRLYPAKDARMDAATFRAGYPQWEHFATFVDPAFSSQFWRRMTA
jgi:FAD/FMN-containing dehydrogenase